MHSLQKEHITNLFVMVDEIIGRQKGAGRPGLVKSELITILIWNALTEKQYLLKDTHNLIRRHYLSYFPKLPKYSAFVELCHRVLPEMIWVLKTLLSDKSPLRFLDSTMVPVCRLHRADNYKVAREMVGLGKNHQGFHFGFKLHGSVNEKGQLCAIALTSADCYDGHLSKKLTDKHTKIAVGDTHYGGRAQTQPLYEKNGTIFLAYPHQKQNKKLLAGWQKLLLDMRSKIECVWDYLKEHMRLVTSFPRSAKGYLVHYLPIILAYQLSVL
jgi:hypothetical protein